MISNPNDVIQQIQEHATQFIDAVSGEEADAWTAYEAERNILGRSTVKCVNKRI
jgi:hypothetical protein